MSTMIDVGHPRQAASGSVAEQFIAKTRAEGESMVGPESPLAQLTNPPFASTISVRQRQTVRVRNGASRV
jgi:hypothetical protein